MVLDDVTVGVDVGVGVIDCVDVDDWLALMIVLWMMWL